MFRSLVDRLKSRANAERPRQPALPRRTFRPSVESLEDRRTPSAMLTIGDATVLEGNDGTQHALVTVSLTEPHGNSVTVNYDTADGTATAGSDYDAVSGRLTFDRNEVSKSILVPIRGDRLVEPDGSFSVRLSGAKGAKIARGEGHVTIVDDEPRVSINAVSVTEGNTGAWAATFTLSLSRAYDRPVTVQYATADQSATAGLDYTAVSGTWIFQPGETSHPITVMVTGDRLPESTETFAVNVSTADSYAQVINGTGVGTIFDNEPRISISDAYSEGGTSFTFTVNLTALPDEPVTVNFATADGTASAGGDYVATAGALTFDGVTSLTITVEAFDPTIAPDKYFYVQLSGASTNAVIDYGSAVGYFDYSYYDGGWYSYDPYSGYWYGY